MADHKWDSTGSRGAVAESKRRRTTSVSKLKDLPQASTTIPQKPKRVHEQPDILEITEDLFEPMTVISGPNKDVSQQLVIKKEFYPQIIYFMCGDESLGEELILSMLNKPAANKDIQLLAKYGIVHELLGKFYSLFGGADFDNEAFDITIFMLKNDFFEKSEVEANLNLLTPIPFFKLGIEVEGLTVENRSKMTNLPADLKKLPSKESETYAEDFNAYVEKLKDYVNKRFAKLIEAIKEDFNKRLAAEKAVEEDKSRETLRTTGYYYKG